MAATHLCQGCSKHNCCACAGHTIRSIIKSRLSGDRPFPEQPTIEQICTTAYLEDDDEIPIEWEGK